MSVVLGIFSDRQNAESAVTELESIGYDPKDISILMKNVEGKVEATNAVEDTAEGAAKGIGAGAVVGGLLGLLAATVIPGIGGLLVGGPIAAALGLTGAAATTVSGMATGALAGGLLGGLTGAFGLTEDEAKVYETRISEGGILVAVPTSSSDQEEVQNVMNEYGADNIRFVQSDKNADRAHRRVRSDEYVGRQIGVAGGRTKRRVM